ncbi:hypothetical protein ACJ7C5_00125 [Nocardiopsis yanglingensis]
MVGFESTYRHIDQRHRVVIQPGGLLLHLTRGRVVAQPLPCFAVQRDLSRATGRGAQHALAAVIVTLAFQNGTALLHRVHAVGIVVGERVAASAGGQVFKDYLLSLQTETGLEQDWRRCAPALNPQIDSLAGDGSG